MRQLNQTETSLFQKFQTTLKQLVSGSPDQSIYIHDPHKIVILKFNAILVPKGIKLNEEALASLDDENFLRLIELLIKSFSIEVFRYFDKIAADIYKLFDQIRQEISDDMFDKTQDIAVKKIIMDNLQVSSVSAHTLQNMIVVKTNGMLETFQVFLVDPRVKQPSFFKSEISSLFSHFYITYLQLLRQQKSIILRQLKSTATR